MSLPDQWNTDTTRHDAEMAELQETFESDKAFITEVLSHSLTYDEHRHEDNARALDDIRSNEEYSDDQVAELIALIPIQYHQNEFIAQNYSGKDYSLLQRKVIAQMAGRM